MLSRTGILSLSSVVGVVGRRLSSSSPFRIFQHIQSPYTRGYYLMPVKGITTTSHLLQEDKITVYFKKKSGKVLTGTGKVGENLLDVVVNNEIDIDGFGACEGTLACSTCHLIFKQEDYDRLGSQPSDEELDMLDLAYGLTDTSRLGCQVKLTKALDGLEAEVPEGINDQRVGS